MFSFSTPPIASCVTDVYCNVNYLYINSFNTNIQPPKQHFSLPLCGTRLELTFHNPYNISLFENNNRVIILDLYTISSNGCYHNFLIPICRKYKCCKVRRMHLYGTSLTKQGLERITNRWHGGRKHRKRILLSPSQVKFGNSINMLF